MPAFCRFLPRLAEGCADGLSAATTARTPQHGAGGAGSFRACMLCRRTSAVRAGGGLFTPCSAYSRLPQSQLGPGGLLLHV